MSDDKKPKFCMHCGSPVEIDKKFCANCGKPHSTAEELIQESTTPPPAPAPPTQAVQQVQPATQAQAPQVVVLQTESSKKEEDTPSLLWKFGTRFAIGFAAVYALFFIGDMFAESLDPVLPFIGVQSEEAVGMAQAYVDSIYPEFSEAEQSVSAVKMNGVPVYIIDFVYHEEPLGPSGLRVLVTKRLDSVWAQEFIDGR
ncbi:MAG: zinc ribbon domain-containing protein [Chloroflexi bacterium]|nr:MAG: zinc ribbon domain-containing protein [Chloroflexota bacterium]MBL1195044.1 zinc ribbon domain-containing protein [Chloroflexota bacterium]NOH12332.1 zinc ribbon domain-containing protein [Chloroflexota bacterium]